MGEVLPNSLGTLVSGGRYGPVTGGPWLNRARHKVDLGQLLTMVETQSCPQGLSDNGEAQPSHGVLPLADRVSCPWTPGSEEGRRRGQCVWYVPRPSWPGPALSTQCCSFSLSRKPSEAPELDEDEGFSDWSQKPEQQRQHWAAGEMSDCGAPPRSESLEGQQGEDRQVGVKAWRQGCQPGALSKSPACA